MEIKFKTEELFCKDGQSAEDYLRDCVVNEIADRCLSNIQPEISTAINKTITTKVVSEVDRVMAGITDEILDYEFTEVSSWGEKKDTYTVRSRILNQIETQCVYKKNSYPSDNSAFTKAIDETVYKKMQEFRAEFYKEVDTKFMKDAFEYAKKQFEKKLK